MKYRILHYGEEPLKAVSKPIEKIDDDIKRLVDDMFETMYAANGVGLAAPQIGKNIRVVVIDCGDDPIAMVNPRIIKMTGKENGPEGCLSFPGLSENVTRATKVIAEYTDPNDGEVYEIEGEGLLARAIQHELDHLDGVVFVDRMSKARRLQIKYELELIKQGESLYEEDEETEESPIEAK